MNKQVLLIGPEFSSPLGDTGRGPPSPEGLAWSVAPGALEALAAMRNRAFDAVVADLDLPGADGTQLLEEIMRRHPQCLRFVYGAVSQPHVAAKCLGRAHQVIAKPASMGTLARAVERAFKLQTWLPTEAALRLVAGSTRLPSPPSVYFRVVEELDSPNCSVSRAGALIAQDAAMTVKLLQVVNSAVFGLGMQVTTPEEAVLYLGVEATKSLILLAHSFSYFDRAGRLPLSLEALWRHALVTGQCARVIAQAEGLAAEETGLTFTAGLLHDLGKLVLAANRPQDLAAAHAQAQAHAGTLWEAERDLLGATHADVAGCLLALWGLPTAIVEAVALHHTPVALFSSAFNPLTAVHVANVLAHDLAPGEQGPALSVIDQAYVAHLGLADRLDPWRARCQESGLASQPNLP